MEEDGDWSLRVVLVCSIFELFITIRNILGLGKYNFVGFMGVSVTQTYIN